MDYLQDLQLALAGERQFAVQALQGFVDLRQVGLEVYGFDGVASVAFSKFDSRSCPSRLGFPAAVDGFSGLFIRGAAAFSFAFVPELFAFGQG